VSGQGPTPMALGPYQFRALGFSFQSVGRDTETNWAEIPVAYREDSLQWTGPKSTSIVIDGCIFDHEYGGQDSLEGVRRAAKTGMPLYFVTRGGDLGGLHVVMSISEDMDYFDGRGRPWKNSYSITLRQYGGSGSTIGALGRLVSLI
jgi:phage protein U